MRIRSSRGRSPFAPVGRLGWLASAIVAVGMGVSASAAHAATTSVVVVDYGHTVGAVNYSASGFLHPFRVSSPVPDERFTPLKPKFFRFAFLDSTLYARATRLGARYQLVVSDTWGYPNPTYGWPWQNPLAWQNHCTKLAQQAKAAGMDISWDIWNEPNTTELWQGSADQWLVAYLQAFQAIRSVLTNAEIGGPSFSGWRAMATNVTAFADFCLASGCEINFLSWHEFNTGGTWTIPRHIANARAQLSQPQYAPLKNRYIYINETVAAEVQYSPGQAVASLFYLEAGGADAVAKACWDVNCRNDTIDGILDPATLSATGMWWAYWGYGQQTGQRVASGTNDAAVVGIASVDGSSRQVLVGYAGHMTPDPTPRDVKLKLKNLGTATSLHVSVLRIPNTDSAPLAAPVSIRDERDPVVDGTLTLTMTAVAPEDALIVLVDP